MLPSSQAGSPENLEDVGWVFGGVYLDANESGNSTSSLSELPAIVEDYTATWCTNCVTVEDALNDIAENNNMKTYHFHRFINENEDPLGSQEGDDRWINRYEQRLPPTVIFNGTIRQIGSIPDGDSLQDDYNKNLETSINLGIGSSSLGWAISNNSNPIATWNLAVDMSNFPQDSEIKSYLWVVEEVAYFPDGGNEEEYYHKSVRTIIDLGNATTGSLEVTLPAAYDGDDLQVHLIHEVVLPEPDGETPEEPNEEDTEEEDDSSLPSIGLAAVVAMTMFAAVTVQRKQQ
jgi:thiol-disulfide isomerase/thioredoxin